MRRYVTRETAVFAALVAVLGWVVIDLPTGPKLGAVGFAVALYVGASLVFNYWRQRNLAPPDGGE